MVICVGEKQGQLSNPDSSHLWALSLSVRRKNLVTRKRTQPMTPGASMQEMVFWLS